MASADGIQPLFATFFFGIAFQTAIIAFIKYANGHVSTLFQDRRRLVLATFFTLVALWILIDFISFMIPSSSPNACQVTVAISTALDQGGRIIIEGFLLWALACVANSSAEKYGLGFVIGLRMVAGGLEIGFTRPQYGPLCIPRSDLLPSSVIVISLDGIVIGILTIRILTLGAIKRLKEGLSVTMQRQHQAFVLCVVGLSIWTVCSMTMLLGLNSLDLFVRTGLPAIGVTILIAIIIFSMEALLSPWIENESTPEARSPFVAPPPDMIGSDESVLSTSAFWVPQGRHDVLQLLSGTTRTVVSGPDADRKRTFLDRQHKSKPDVRKLGISGPVLNEITPSSNMAFTRVATVDLASAAAAERERRELYTRVLIAQRPAPQPPKLAPLEGLNTSISTRRKAVISGSATQKPNENSMLSASVGSTSTSTLLSPGKVGVRGRSPRRAVDYAPGVIMSFADPALRNLPPTLQHPQTVMAVNKMAYNNPNMVKTVVSNTIAKNQVLGKTDSILNRPRPTRKKGREVFPAETSFRHKPSKSGSSIVSRESILQANSGTPTALPPLPTPPTSAPPTSAAKLRKLLPNDTRSMTVSEKMSLMFPAPPGVDLRQHRRSSVPPLPRIPAEILAHEFLDIVDDEPQSRRESKRTTITSSTARVSAKGVYHIGLHPTYRFSANTHQQLTDDIQDGDLDSTAEPTLKTKNDRNMLQSRFTVTTISSEETSVATTIWESLHSPIQPSDLKARQNAQQVDLSSGLRAQTRAHHDRDLPKLPISKISRGTEVILDHGELIPPQLDTDGPNSKSFGERDSSYLVTSRDPQWHLRIGDDIPAFSERRKNLKSRAMPPPTPLVLPTSDRNGKVLQRENKPDPILESPRQILKQLKEHLKRYEEPSEERSSIGSLSRTLPASSIERDETCTSAQALLENIEKEMGRQENHWMQMQHNFDRDSSNSDLLTRPFVPPHDPKFSPAQTRFSSETASPVMTPSVSEVGLNSSDNANQIKSDQSVGAVLTQGSDSSRASMWQKQLVEAQIQYIEHAPPPLLNENLSFLSVENNRNPSESSRLLSGYASIMGIDSKMGENNDVQLNIEPRRPTESLKLSATLWQPKTMRAPQSSGSLWVFSRVAVDTSKAVYSTPAATTPRLACRESNQPSLKIESSNLWSMPVSRPIRSIVGLWGSRAVRPKSIVTKQTARRPQRRSNRINLLPDIIESPSPLPNKGDTLGIFKFPWGEKSDSAMYQPPLPPPIPAMSLPPHPGLATSTVLDARSYHLEPEPNSYSSSFFDDYDDEYDDDLDPELDSDDDFDESTLWEIANLLDSKDVPSRKSLLPPPRIIEDYDDSEDEEVASNTASRAQVLKFIPIQALAPRSPRAESRDQQPSKSISPDEEKNLSLDSILSPSTIPRSEERDLNNSALSNSGFIDSSNVDILTESRAVEERPETLWGKAIAHVTQHANAQSAAALDQKTLSAIKASSGTIAMLWTPPRLKMATEVIGLFRAHIEMPALCSSEQVPAALLMSKKTRLDRLNIKNIESQELWSHDGETQAEHHWISESSTRPKSPSLYSVSSSGRSSPEVSDSSSLASASTMASSVWTARPLNADEGTPAWWESRARSRSNSTNDLPLLEPTVYKAKTTTKVKSSLAPVRESRVLDSCDLWEEKAEISQNTSTPIHYLWSLYDSQLNTSATTPENAPSLWAVTPRSAKQSAADVFLSTTRPTERSRSASRAPVINPVYYRLSTSMWQNHLSVQSTAKHWLHYTSVNQNMCHVETETPKARPAQVSMIFPNDFWKQYACEGASQPPLPQSSTSVNDDTAVMPKLQRSKSTIVPVAWKRASIWTPPPPLPPVVRIGERGERVRGSRLWEEPKKPEETEHETSIKTEIMILPHPDTMKRNSKSMDRRPLQKVQSTQLWRPKWGLPQRPDDWKINDSNNRGTDY